MTPHHQPINSPSGRHNQERTQRLPSRQAQKQYWDERWNRAQATYPNAWARRRAGQILSMLHSLPLQGPRILDMGCGTGWFTEELTTIGEATGVELSEAAVSVARQRYPHARFIAGNVLEMALPPTHFDVVISLEVIAHVEDQDRYLERAAQTLKPGGYLIITTVNKFVHERTDWPEDSPAHIRYWLDRRSFKALLSRNGFEIRRLTSVIPMGHGGILRLVNSHLLNTLLARITSEGAVEQLKERLGLGWTWVALAQKVR